MMPNACPKPARTRKQEKAREDRQETKREQEIRALCVDRDGDCRLNDPALWLLFGSCSGASQWAHLGEYRRFRTVGKDPEDRHTTAGSLMLCTLHHNRYDGSARPRLYIKPATGDHGADGPLAIANDKTTYVEERKDLRWRNRVN